MALSGRLGWSQAKAWPGRPPGPYRFARDLDSAAQQPERQTRHRSHSVGASHNTSVGIVSAGMYLPDRVLTAAEIAEESGLPEWVVRDKLGIEQKHMAGPEDHPNEMAIKAALDCLSKTTLTPKRSTWCCAPPRSGANTCCGRRASTWPTRSAQQMPGASTSIRAAAPR